MMDAPADDMFHVQPLSPLLMADKGSPGPAKLVVRPSSSIMLPDMDAKNEMWLNAIGQQQQVEQNQELRRQLDSKATALVKGRKRLTSTITWLTTTNIGVSLAAMVATLVILLLIKPAFIKKKPPNELEEPKLSLTKLIALSALAGGVVLLTPVWIDMFRWIKTRTTPHVQSLGTGNQSGSDF